MNHRNLVVGFFASLLILTIAAAGGHAALPQAPGQIELSAAQFDFEEVCLSVEEANCGREEQD
jgi:hypothetical protein